jgi:hypothetical protein
VARHLNPYFHWCAGCWKWVCDCVHCDEPLNIKRQPAKDIQIRSVGYDRRRGRLEIEFTWTDDGAAVLPGWASRISAIARVETSVFVLESPFGFAVGTRAAGKNGSRLCVDDGERAEGTASLRSMTSNAAKLLSL